jgi:hypothetical protein
VSGLLHILFGLPDSENAVAQHADLWRKVADMAKRIHVWGGEDALWVSWCPSHLTADEAERQGVSMVHWRLNKDADTLASDCVKEREGAILPHYYRLAKRRVDLAEIVQTMIAEIYIARTKLDEQIFHGMLAAVKAKKGANCTAEIFPEHGKNEESTPVYILKQKYPHADWHRADQNGPWVLTPAAPVVVDKWHYPIHWRAALRWYWANIRGEGDPEKGTSGAAWVELAADFTASTGVSIKGLFGRGKRRRDATSWVEVGERFAFLTRAAVDVNAIGEVKRVASMGAFGFHAHYAGTVCRPRLLSPGAVCAALAQDCYDHRLAGGCDHEWWLRPFSVSPLKSLKYDAVAPVRAAFCRAAASGCL